MGIKEFISQYNNSPILFIGTGISLRYLNEAKSWDGLLNQISNDLTDDNREYLDLKSLAHDKNTGVTSWKELGSKLAKKFDDHYKDSTNPQISEIQEKYYDLAKKSQFVSPFKLYISKITQNYTLKEGIDDELEAFKSAVKNVSSIITTNYDTFIEDVLKFNPLVGNDILLTNPYGSVYKIHGTTSYDHNAERIVITSSDYENFDKKYSLIKSQLLSLFIHHPIIFLGYSVSDENIKKILQEIFSCLEPNSELAQKIKNNFLVVEYKKDSVNTSVSDYGVQIDNSGSINIKRIQTDNYKIIYDSIAELTLEVPVMYMRAIKNLSNIICEPSSDSTAKKVQIIEAENIANLTNGSFILSVKPEVNNVETPVNYQSQDFIDNYFDIIKDNKTNIIRLLDGRSIPKGNSWFPSFKFAEMCPDISNFELWKTRQQEKIEELKVKLLKDKYIRNVRYNSINTALAHQQKSYIKDIILLNILNDNISFNDIPEFIKSDNIIKLGNEKTIRTYKNRLICIYDYLYDKIGVS